MTNGRMLASIVGLALAACSAARDRAVIGSKNFTEQVILGELLAQQVEARAGVPAARRLNLGGTLVCHRALVTDEIHAYVEYSGTARTTILKESHSADREALYNSVRRAYLERFNLEWLPPLGFSNSFAILVRADDARRLGLHSISDLARQAGRYRAAFGYEFLERPDGFPGLAKRYRLRFAQPPGVMDLALTYHALADKKVDVIAGDSTNGLIPALGLVVLEDDQRYFPAYDAAPVVSRRLADRVPTFREALRGLAGQVSEEDMRSLNYEVDGKRRDVPTVVREFRRHKNL